MEDSRRTTSKRNYPNLKQQTLSAWKPLYTSSSVSIAFIIIGVILVPIGIAVLIVSSDNSATIREFIIDYTDCVSVKNSSVTCAEYIQAHPPAGVGPYERCECKVDFTLSKQMKGNKIYMYYGLENFHQNIRKYVNSKDNDQLLGKLGTFDNPAYPDDYCKPLDKDADGKIYFPCGAIANSMFNDTIQLYFNDELQGQVRIHQNRKGIAWAADVKHKFKNPPEFSNKSHPIWSKFANPKGWSQTLWDLDPSDPDNNGVQNEDFMVWMRVAAFSNFRKLYRIIDTSEQDILNEGLPAGKYHLKIKYTYEVASFEGKKSVILNVPTVFGVKNTFQGLGTSVVGGISTVLGLLFLLSGCSGKRGKGLFLTSA